MKDKKLTPKQKTVQTQRAVKKHLKEIIEPLLMQEIEKEFNSNLPDEFLTFKNTEIKDFIINKYLN